MKIRSQLLQWPLLVGLMWAGLWLTAQTTPGSNDRLNAVDILRYDFQLTLSDTSDRILGVATVKGKLLQPAQSVRLDLVAATGGKGMKVLQVMEGDQQREFKHAGEALEIQFPAQRAAEEEFIFRIEYAGVPADGLIISNSEADGRSFFGDNWPNRAHHWLPVIDHPTDKAPVGFTVLAPAHYQIVANGKLVEQKVFPDGHQISVWNNEAPLPTKVMVVGAADFAIADAGNVGDIPVSTWVFNKDQEAGFSDYAQGRAILDWFVKQVGAYPWDKLANVQSRTRYGGMENASCIFYADNSVTGDGSCEALMAHEIAHQWFGNSASEANWYHLWLSEGFATYWTHVYFEQLHGNEVFLKRLREDRAAIQGWSPTFKYAVVDDRIADLNQLLNINSYQKGGWVLHMLRQTVGDDLFFKGLREYYARFKFGNAFTSDLQKVMEEVSGKDLSQFFNQWIFRPGHPNLEVTWKWSKGQGKLNLVIVQKQAGEAFQFPLEIGLEDYAGNVVQVVEIQVSGKSQKATIACPAKPFKLQLDPQVKLLFDGKVVAK